MQNLAQEVVNRVCPVCGMPVDEHLPPVIGVVADDEIGDRIVRIGACGGEHAEMVRRDPAAYVDAAIGNETARGFEDA